MPANNITLSSSIRQNLLSLQNTTRLLDLTSNRLSTGLKVNSSLDNPAAFFAARSLTNRAADLSTRKNGIGQAVSLLQSTDKSLTALTSLVEQAKAKATEADEAATAGISTISTEKATTVSGITTISTKLANTPANDTINLTDAGAAVVDIVKFVINEATVVNITTSVGITIAQVVSTLTALSGITAVFNARTNQIDITGNGGSDITITEVGTFFTTAGFTADGSTFNESAGLKTYATQNKDTDLVTDVFGLADNNTIISNLTDTSPAVTFTTESGNSAGASTIADLVATMSSVDTGLTVTYNTTTSKIDIRAAEGVSVDFSGTGFTAINLNDGTSNLTSGVVSVFSKFGTATQVGALTTDFRTLLNQINGLISDASYKGTNLLKASTTLDVKFNAVGDSKLSILGKSLEADTDGILTGLKFTQKAADYDFQTAGDITAALADVESSITELRTIASTFGTTLGVLQTREDFTIELVNALENGAAKLVNANLEEESAKLLALQTRQAIGVQSLAISNTSQQSILALFR